MWQSFLICAILLSCNTAIAEQEYTNEEIAEAIFQSEGGYKTNYPYGIKSVYCNGIQECKQICLNTIQANRIRYAEYGYKTHKTYLGFLQSRYCPSSIRGCENWLPNVQYFLKKGNN